MAGTPATVVPGIADFGRLHGLRKDPHDGFNVLYLGAGNPGKLHPGFFELMSRVQVPGIRVTVAGSGFDRLPHDQMDATRFQLLPFREDIKSLFESADVFAYPLSATTYATSDKSLQEAMFAGVPPVMFRHGGPARFVQHGQTGLVAETDDEFVEFIEQLYRNPHERQRLGSNARSYAAANFAPEKPAQQLIRILERACQIAKRSQPALTWPLPISVTAAALFLTSIGQDRTRAISGLSGWISGSGEVLDSHICELPSDVFTLEGGLIQWRNSCLDDAALRFWAGLWLMLNRRFKAAAIEFAAAAENGASSSRCAALQELAAVLSSDLNGQNRRRRIARTFRDLSLPRLADVLVPN